MGPSGAGKSTLARAIAGLVPWATPGRLTGDLLVGGTRLGAGEPTALLGRVGVVFQDPSSQLVMERVEDDVAVGLEGRRWPRDAMLRRVPEALAEVGLGGYGRRRTSRLSGGEQQRLALAGAFAPRPGLLVLDEPTANLDPPGALAFVDRLREVRARELATIVLVDHRAELAWPLADLVLALGADGRPLALGRPAELLADRRADLAAAGIWLPDDPVTSRPPAGGDPAPASGDLLVEVCRAGFAYERDHPVLEDVDLQVRGGERVALLGPNGSGKTTLARLIVGLLRPSAGSVRLVGRDPAGLPPAQLARLAGYVVQDPERSFLAPTVEAELRAGLTAQERTRVGDLAERLGLPLARFAARNPYTLSGGEQRRLSLGAQLIRRPSLLVLDEPTFGQDRRTYQGLVEILRDRLDGGAALVAATHDMRFVAEVADRIVRLGDPPGAAGVTVAPGSAA